MANELDNPVLTDDAEAKFMEAAALADAGRDIPSDLLPGAKSDSPADTDKPETVADGEQQQTDNSETDPEKAKERPRDALGRFTKTEDGKDIPEAERKPAEAPVEVKKPEEPKQLSEFEAKKQERQKKEQERQDRSWEALNRQKDEIAQARAELEKQRQQMTQQVQHRQAPQQQREFSSKELFEAHRDFKGRAKAALTEGNYDAFNENEALAEKALEHAQQFYQIEAQEAQQSQVQKYNQAWTERMAATIEKDADLANPETPLSKAVQSLLETHGQVFYMIPDGFPKVVEIAKLRLEAGSASELREANKQLQAEVERLNGLTAPSVGGPTSQPAKKKFDELSPEEQEERLMTAARAIDESRN